VSLRHVGAAPNWRKRAAITASVISAAAAAVSAGLLLSSGGGPSAGGTAAAVARPSLAPNARQAARLRQDPVPAGTVPHSVQLDKVASPTEYAKAGQLISYTYTVTNTGAVALRHITLTDDKLGAITCPMSTLVPGKWMTCHAVYTTTKADVRAGHIRNVALAVGWPPRGAKVTARAEAKVVARTLPVVLVTG
jgi:hypothetical protein